MPASETRLGRLLSLLESEAAWLFMPVAPFPLGAVDAPVRVPAAGTTDGVRKMAAEQIGEIQKYGSSDANVLLAKVRTRAHPSRSPRGIQPTRATITAGAATSPQPQVGDTNCWWLRGRGHRRDR